jgi:hypothetical protein
MRNFTLNHGAVRSQRKQPFGLLLMNLRDASRKLQFAVESGDRPTIYKSRIEADSLLTECQDLIDELTPSSSLIDRTWLHVAKSSFTELSTNLQTASSVLSCSLRAL